MSRIFTDSYPNKWHFYRTPLTGNPCAECLTCGEIYVYWETEDIEYHTQQHEQEKTK